MGKKNGPRRGLLGRVGTFVGTNLRFVGTGRVPTGLGGFEELLQTDPGDKPPTPVTRPRAFELLQLEVAADGSFAAPEGVLGFLNRHVVWVGCDLRGRFLGIEGLGQGGLDESCKLISGDDY